MGARSARARTRGQNPLVLNICITISQLSKRSHEMFSLLKYGFTIKARFGTKMSLITIERIIAYESL
jgi:hypothetical protein